MQLVINEDNQSTNTLFLISSTTSTHWSVVTNRRGQTLGHIVMPEQLLIVDVPLFVSPPEAPEFEYDEEDLVAHHEEAFVKQELPRWLEAGYTLDCCEDISADCDTIFIAARVEASYNNADELMNLLRFTEAHI